MEAQLASLSPEMLATVSAALGFVVGAVIFYLMGKRSALNPENNPLQKPYEDLKNEFATYRRDVNSHFARTADAVDNLTKSYQEVFTHLSDGAEKLMDKKALQAEIQKRQGKAITLAYLTGQNPNESAKPKNISNASVISDSKAVESAKSGVASVVPRPADATKPATQPKTNATQQDKNTVETSKPTSVESKETQKEVAPSTVEKSNALKAAEKAGLMLSDDAQQTDSLEAVKSHIRNNQPK